MTGQSSVICFCACARAFVCGLIEITRAMNLNPYEDVFGG